MAATGELLLRMADSDSAGVSALVPDLTSSADRAWQTHLSLFPVAQRVQNPPYINPHLPKMYRIYREFLPYLAAGDVPALVRLEINEYTQRPKLGEMPKPPRSTSAVSFPEIASSIGAQEPLRAAALLDAFMAQRGKAELARNLLLLGSGYLDQSLGHSVSCTAFILLEMLERPEQDPWPTLYTLADYFCKGGFYTLPALGASEDLPSNQAQDRRLLAATSGSGIVNLHHTITRYAMERVRHLLGEAGYAHLIARWTEFLGAKRVRVPSAPPTVEMPAGYDEFYELFSRRKERPVLAALGPMTASKEGRQRLGRYLVKGLCDLYRGSYNPHFLTGLGTALWVVETYWDRPEIAMNALRQYVDYYFTELSG